MSSSEPYTFRVQRREWLRVCECGGGAHDEVPVRERGARTTRGAAVTRSAQEKASPINFGTCCDAPRTPLTRANRRRHPSFVLDLTPAMPKETFPDIHGFQLLNEIGGGGFSVCAASSLCLRACD